jgi:hypothetical protein
MSIFVLSIVKSTRGDFLNLKEEQGTHHPATAGMLPLYPGFDPGKMF